VHSLAEILEKGLFWSRCRTGIPTIERRRDARLRRVPRHRGEAGRAARRADSGDGWQSSRGPRLSRFEQATHHRRLPPPTPAR